MRRPSSTGRRPLRNARAKAPSTMRSKRRSNPERPTADHCMRPAIVAFLVTRASGGIGRRAGFRFQCPKGRGGSSPPSPTHSPHSLHPTPPLSLTRPMGRSSATETSERVRRNGELRRLGGVEARGVDAVDRIPIGMDDDFTGFYRDAYPGAVRLAWLLTHDHAAAEDVVQEAFVRLRPRLATVDNRSAYLRAAIVNGCRDRARSAGRADAGFRRIRLVADVSSTDKPSELLDVVAGLPYKQRAVLVLRYWGDLREEEIAEIVGVRSATVRSITSRALARLRKELPDEH